MKEALAIPLLASTLALVLTGTVSAQDQPSRVFRLVVPNTPGNIQDTVARVMAPEMSRFLGQPVIIENKPGAGGLIGLEYVAKQLPADGYAAASVAVASLATLPVTVKDLRFDPLADLPPVIGLIETRFVFGSASQLPWKSLNELVVHAKATPGRLNYGSPAPSVRLPTEVLLRGLGLDIVYVPYAGAAPYFKAVVAGEVQMGLVNEPQAIAFGDRFRVLAVTGERRSSHFPDAPTMTELGYRQIRGLSYSFNVRSGTPKPAIERLSAASSYALRQPEVRARFANLHVEIIDEPQDAAASRLSQDAKLFQEVAAAIGFKPE